MNICVYGASSDKVDNIFIDSSYSLGRAIAKGGHTVIFGGGAKSVMGAVARGCYDNGGKVIGIAPAFFNVDGVLFENCEEFIYPDTMRERKRLLEEKSDAFIIAPGGIGTFDEFFEILTLKQLERHNKPIVIYNVNNYYTDMVNMLKKITEMNFMRDKTLSLFKIMENENEIINYIENYDEKPVGIVKLKHIKWLE